MKSSTSVPKRGARQSKQTISHMAEAWFAHHKTSFSDSFWRLLATPIQSVLTWLVVAIALVLPATLFLVLENAQMLGQGWRGNTELSVFLHDKAKPQAIEKVHQRIVDFDEVEQVELVLPDQALEEFERYSGFGDVLNSLDENPLPAVLMITPKAVLDSPEKLAQFKQKLAADPLVAHVQLDMGWLRRLYEMLLLAERMVIALAGLLALGVLLIVGNTIGLAIENRREEIVVVKLVGGTDGFVRRPFLYTGWWFGLGGGILAMLLILVGAWWFSGPIEALSSLYSSEYSLKGLDLQFAFIVIIGSGLLGWLGAWLAVNRHLKQIQPK